MARAKSKSDEPAPDEGVASNADDYMPEDIEFLQFVSQYDPANGGGIHVYREGPGGYRDLTFVKAFAFGEFEPPMLQQPPFNGGKFRVHVRSATGMLRNFPFKCEPATVPDAQRQAQPDAALTPLVAGMLEGFKALSAQIAQIAAQGNKGMDVESTIRLFGTLQGMTGARQSVDPIEMIERIVTLQKTLVPERPPVNEAGEVDTGALIMQAMKTFGEPFAEIIRQNSQRANGTVLHNPATPALAKPAAMPGPLPASGTSIMHEQPNEGDEMNFKIAMVKPILIASARADLPVETYADVVLNTFSDDEINRFINAPDWRAELVKEIPEAAEVMPWFEALRASVLDAMKPEEPGAVDGGEPKA